VNSDSSMKQVCSGARMMPFLQCLVLAHYCPVVRCRPCSTWHVLYMVNMQWTHFRETCKIIIGRKIPDWQSLQSGIPLGQEDLFQNAKHLWYIVWLWLANSSCFFMKLSGSSRKPYYP
jgi:hypothetical protein